MGPRSAGRPGLSGLLGHLADEVPQRAAPLAPLDLDVLVAEDAEPDRRVHGLLDPLAEVVDADALHGSPPGAPSTLTRGQGSAVTTIVGTTLGSSWRR